MNNISIPELQPKDTMGRNEPCWCGSKIKWKKCHRDRHLQKSEPIGLLQNKIFMMKKEGKIIGVKNN